MREDCKAIQSRRIFVGNLPNTVNEQILQEEFANYGNVEKLELKTKGLGDGQTQFAFVTLSLVSEEDINKCLNRFARYKFHGEFLKVEVARESFMDRLKREWAERDATQTKKNDKTEIVHGNIENEIGNQDLKKQTEIISKNGSESSSGSSSSESSSDSDTKSNNKLNKVKQREGNKDKLQCKVIDNSDCIEERKQNRIDNNNSKKESKFVNRKESESSDSSSTSSSDDSSDSSSQSRIRRNKTSKTAPDKIKANDEPTTFIAKKHAQSSLRNGKIKIQPTSADPIHIISKKNIVHKTLEGSAKESDKKRKESLHKMKDQYNKQKLAIKQALTNIDSSKKTSKIVFEDDDDVDNTFQEHTTNESKRKKLFNDNNVESGDDSEDYSKAFEIKEQYQGVKGAELLKLQSRFKLDPRFAMDKRFLEASDEVDEKETVSKDNTPHDDERKWQLDIIGQVVGKKINTERPTQIKPVKNLITRFDPSKEEHKKFYKSTKEEDINASSDLKLSQGIEQQPEVEVSKERYYVVSDDLKDAIMTSGQGFSLLSMLGRAKDSPDRVETFQPYVEMPLERNKTASIALDNPFKYDSSDSEDEDKNKTNNTSQTKPNHQKTKNTSKNIDLADMLFFLPDDKRLEEGLDFFATPEIDPDRDYDEVKRNLRKIINRKIAKKRKHTEGFKTVASKFKKSKKSNR